MKSRKLPETDSIEELAQFWDTNDLTDFEDQLEEIAEPVFERKPEMAVKIYLSHQEIEAVKRIAKSKGIAQETLLREWVLEKLHG